MNFNTKFFLGNIRIRQTHVVNLTAHLSNIVQRMREYMKDLENSILLGFSGISRTAEKHAKQKIENIRQGKQLIIY